MQDVVKALIAHLKTVTAITDLTSTRIWGDGLPETEVVNMPRKNIVIAHAGGVEEFRNHALQRARLDIFCYGEGYQQAASVDGAVADALREISRIDVSNTLLHSAGYGGAMRLKHPDAGWEYLMRSTTILAGETTTA